MSVSITFKARCNPATICLPGSRQMRRCPGIFWGTTSRWGRSQSQQKGLCASCKAPNFLVCSCWVARRRAVCWRRIQAATSYVQTAIICTPA